MTSITTPSPSRTPFLERVATAPISWGVCEVPGWGHQLPPERVLFEMNKLGFTATELGSAGWLPTDPGELAAILGRHQLDLLAAFVPLVIHRADRSEATLAEAAEQARLLAALGARYFNTAPVTSNDWQPRHRLTEGEWRTVAENLKAIDAICAENGLVQVLHEHVGCVVERSDEVQRIIDTTETLFVLDTGHLAVGGVDPVRFAADHADRVGLVHLKDLRLDVAERLNRGELTLMEAVQASLFPALGEGDLNIAGVIDALENAGFDGWYVIEQDCALPADLADGEEGPVADVARSVEFLRALV